jgi:hypothetical protein
MIIYCHSHRITTLPGFISALQNYAINLSHPDLPRHRLFDRVKAGLENYYGNTNFSVPRPAISIENLHHIHALLDSSSFADVRLWCASLFAFFALLRINEYANGSLLVSHVTAHRWGISLNIPFSKTSLIPTTVDIIRRDDQLCPLRAYRAYVSLIPQQHRQSHHPFFLQHPQSTAAMTDAVFIHHVRRLLAPLPDCDPAAFAGHSFRRGGVTALIQAGVPEATIAAHGRWKSLAYRDYIDTQNSLRMRLAATASLSLHSTPSRSLSS